MEIMRLKKDLQKKDCGLCLVNHDQSCDNSKAVTKNKIMTFSPVLILGRDKLLLRDPGLKMSWSLSQAHAQE
jgi:hypothetical protein